MSTNESNTPNAELMAELDDILVGAETNAVLAELGGLEALDRELSIMTATEASRIQGRDEVRAAAQSVAANMAFYLVIRDLSWN